MLARLPLKIYLSREDPVLLYATQRICVYLHRRLLPGLINTEMLILPPICFSLALPNTTPWLIDPRSSSWYKEYGLD